MKHDTEDQEKLRKEQDSVDETVVVDNSNVIDNVSINVSLKNEQVVDNGTATTMIYAPSAQILRDINSGKSFKLDYSEDVGAFP